MAGSDQSKAAAGFRRSQRWIFILLGFLLPIGGLAVKLDDVLGTDLIFGLTLTVFMLAFLMVSAWSFVAYCRWRGKYPFYWLRRK
jgi:membrane protein CcdC involved in cytochrome C biogenesis